MSGVETLSPDQAGRRPVASIGVGERVTATLRVDGHDFMLPARSSRAVAKRLIGLAREAPVHVLIGDNEIIAEQAAYIIRGSRPLATHRSRNSARRDRRQPTSTPHRRVVERVGRVRWTRSDTALRLLSIEFLS